jgi:hypothetical protein
VLRRLAPLALATAGVAVGVIGTTVLAADRASESPCTPATCVPSPRWDSAVGRGISVAGTPYDVIAFSDPDGSGAVGRLYSGGVYRNSVATLTCARSRGRVAVGGYRIVSSDDPELVGKGMLSYGQDNGPTPRGRAVDRGNTYLVDEPPESCPAPDARRANIYLCGELTLRQATPSAPPLVRRVAAKPRRGRSCRGVVAVTPHPRGQPPSMPAAPPGEPASPGAG